MSLFQRTGDYAGFRGRSTGDCLPTAFFDSCSSSQVLLLGHGDRSGSKP